LWTKKHYQQYIIIYNISHILILFTKGKAGSAWLMVMKTEQVRTQVMMQGKIGHPECQHHTAPIAQDRSPQKWFYSWTELISLLVIPSKTLYIIITEGY